MRKGFQVSGVMVVGVLCVLAGARAHAAVTAPKEDLHFLAEHLAEAAQDARYFALPWPSGDEREWQPVVSAGIVRYENDLASVKGNLLSLGAARALDERWRYQVLAFTGRFDVYAGDTEFVLTYGAMNVPLDLPAQAAFTAPSGVFAHDGIGLVVRREPDDRTGSWALVGGALIERLSLRGYRFNYQLLSGANAGATGFVDYSGSNTFLTPFVGAQRDLELGSGWVLALRAAIGVPLPPGEFNRHFTAPGYDESTSMPGGKPSEIGDGYFIVGMSLRDRHSGLEIDFGTLLSYGLVERLTHQGVKSGLLITVTWRGN